MTAVGCRREAEVVSAVLAGGWPSNAGENLLTHVGTCGDCREVLLVTRMMKANYEPTNGEVHVPAAGQVWWRAAVRARLEAAQVAARPLTWLHGLAGASAVGLACALLSVAWPSVREAAGWLGVLVNGVDPRDLEVAGTVGRAVWNSLPVAGAVAVGLMLAPLALYFVLSDD
jgi:hypothetical protein